MLPAFGTSASIPSETREESLRWLVSFDYDVDIIAVRVALIIRGNSRLDELLIKLLSYSAFLGNWDVALRPALYVAAVYCDVGVVEDLGKANAHENPRSDTAATPAELTRKYHGQEQTFRIRGITASMSV